MTSEWKTFEQPQTKSFNLIELDWIGLNRNGAASNEKRGYAERVAIGSKVRQKKTG